MNETNNELLHCPFCGSPADLKRIGNDHTKTRAVQVKCSNIECRVERTDKAMRHGLDWLESVAISNWNRRAASNPASPAPVAAITDVLRQARRALDVAATPLARDRQEVLAAMRAIDAALAAAPQAQAEPVAWIRFRSDGGYEGPIMDAAMESVRKKSGAWTPLYAAPVVAAPAAPSQDASCVWTPHADDSGGWELSCRTAWWFPDGTPKENGVKFCPCCGKPVRLATSPAVDAADGEG